MTCTATDPSGNRSTASFVVTVTSARVPVTGGGMTLVPWALFVLGIGLTLATAAKRRRLV